MKPLRIFISSPGDVAEEREKARLVIEALRRRYGAAVDLQEVMWEDLALDIDLSAQQSIERELMPEDKVPDIAVFILWSRLGSELSEARTPRPGGGSYRSGTEHEFELMLEARERSGGVKPHILAYWRQDEEGFVEVLRREGPGRYDELLRQKQLAGRFVEERFMDEKGRNVRGIVIYREPLSFAERLHRHLRQKIDELLGAEGDPAERWRENPYRGLAVFETAHAAIFHGREEETQDLVERLREQETLGCGFVVVVGTSGAGKSSLARAGVAATLQRLSFDERVREWRHAVFLPSLHGGDLFTGLARMLALSLPELRGGAGGLERFAERLRGNREAASDLLASTLARAGESAGGTVRLLLLLDQMEELWTDRRVEDGTRESFLESLEALAGDGGLTVLATLRSDFYPQAQSSAAFLRMKGERGHFDLAPPGPAALQRVITEPARLAGLRFERSDRTGKSLDQIILADAAKDPAALPLLQDALLELYERRDEDSRLLTFAAYEALGGVEGALARRAVDTFESLSSESREALEEALPLLVSVDTVGEQNAVRRRAALSELTATPARRQLTEALIAARFLTTDEIAGDPVASLAHEALLRRWERVADWISANRDRLRMRARVEQAEAIWKESGCDPSRLLGEGLALEEGRSLLMEGERFLEIETRNYVERSIAYQEAAAKARARRRRMAMVAMGLLAILALGAAGWAWQKQLQAEEARQKTQVQLERSQLEQGRVWLERAKLAWEKDRDTVSTWMLAARAVGFYGFGRKENGGQEFIDNFPALLGAPMSDPEIEIERLAEKNSVMEFANTIPILGLPIWSTPLSLNQHHGEVTSLAFSSDGKRLVTGSADRLVKLWDVASGNLIRAFDGHLGDVNSVAFSPEADRIASGSDDSTVKIWDVETGDLVAELPGHRNGVKCVVFSPDGNWILSAGSNLGTINIWDAKTLNASGTIKAHAKGVNSIAFSPKSNLFTTGSDDAIVKLWETSTWRELSALKGHAEHITSVAFNPNGSQFASGSWDSTIKVWDVNSDRAVHTLKDHAGAVVGIAYGPDGKTIASASNDISIRIWGVESGEVEVIKAGSEAASCLAFSPNGELIATGSEDRAIKIWRASSGHETSSLAGHSGAVIGVKFSPDGSQIASYSQDQIKLWNAATGKEILTLRNSPDWSISLDFSPDGTKIVTGSGDALELWDATSGEKLNSIKQKSDMVREVAFSKDSESIFYCASEYGKIVEFNLSAGVERVAYEGTISKEMAALMAGIADDSINRFTNFGDSYVSVAISENSEKVCIGCKNGNVVLADLKNEVAGGVRSLKGRASDTFVAISPDGNRFASGHSNGEVKLWDATNGEVLKSFKGHSESVTSVTFSPDGRRIASSSSDKFVKIWDASADSWSGKPNNSEAEIATLNGHFGTVIAVEFSPDGNRIASCSDDGTVILWDVGIANSDGGPDRYFDRYVLLDLNNQTELLTLIGNRFRAEKIAISPDNSIVASLVEGKVKLWDAGTGREIASFDGHFLNVGFSPDGKMVAAEHVGHLDKDGYHENGYAIWDLFSGRSFRQDSLEFPIEYINEMAPTLLPDLLESMRDGYFSLAGRQMRRSSSDNFASGKFFSPVYARDDMLSKMAFLEDSSRDKVILRIRLASQAGAWRVIPKLWGDFLKSNLSQDHDIRREFARHLAIGLRSLAMSTESAFPDDLWRLLVDVVEREFFEDPVFSIALLQGLTLFLKADVRTDELVASVIDRVSLVAPRRWLEALAINSEINSESGTGASARSLYLFYRRVLNQHPDSAIILRSAIVYCEGAAKLQERLSLEDRLLGLDDATVGDFTGAAYDAAGRNDGDRANAILKQAIFRFPDEESVYYFGGWSHLLLNNPAGSLEGFSESLARLGPEESPSPYLLVGLAIARWQLNQKEEAISIYHQLIQLGRARNPQVDWADPQTLVEEGWPKVGDSLFEEVRAATLAKHPDLAPKPNQTRSDR